jgi:hypothetical protein
VTRTGHFSLRNLEYAEIVDLSLEECIQMALENSKILRTSSGNQQQINGQAALVLSGAEGQVSSVYDAAWRPANPVVSR